MPEAITPEIALKRKPEAMQIISSKGSFFNLRQYRICIKI